MIKYIAQNIIICLVCLIFFSTNLYSQISGPTQNIILEHADSLLGKQQSGEEIFSGNVSITQGVLNIKSDLVKLFSTQNRATFDGNVKITQPGLVITAASGDYDGISRNASGFGGITLTENNTTISANSGVYNTYSKKAKFRGDVVIRQGNYVVKTNAADYSSVDKRIDFVDGFNLNESTTSLTANNGYYLANTQKSYFSGNVKLNDKDMNLSSDNGEIDNNTKNSKFYGNVKVNNGQMKITSNEVNLVNTSRQATFKGNVKVDDNGTSSISDELFYDVSNNISVLTGNVIVENDSLKLSANNVEYDKKNGTTLIKKNAILKLKKENIIISGDTLQSNSKQGYSRAVGKPKLQIIESKSEENTTGVLLGDTTFISADVLEFLNNDSAKYYKGTGNFLMRKNNVIASSDIGFYNLTDSIISIYKFPEDDINTGLQPDSTEFYKNKIDSSKLNNSKIESSKLDTSKIDTSKKNRINLNDITTKDSKEIIKLNKGKSKGKSLKHESKSNLKTDSSLSKKEANNRQDTTKLLVIMDSTKKTISDTTIIKPKVPVIWYDNSQISGDSISVKTKSRRLENIFAYGNSMAVTQNKFESRYDQMFADTLEFYIVRDSVQKVICKKSAKAIYFLYENEKPNGAEKIVSENIFIDFKYGKPNKIRLYPSSTGSTDGEYFPEGLVINKENNYKLENFRWFKKIL